MFQKENVHFCLISGRQKWVTLVSWMLNILHTYKKAWKRKTVHEKRMNVTLKQLSKNIVVYKNDSSTNESTELIENKVSFSVESADYKPINLFPYI